MEPVESSTTGADDRWRDVPRVSFAQNYEDVRLWKALGHLDDHIWVDVGAAHPVNLSVTRLFHLRGWRGINIEPGPPFEMLCRDRPEDVNIAAVVSDREGEVEFNIAWPHTDLSSLHVRFLESDPVNVQSWETVRRPTLTLASILDMYAGEAGIAFLKVDVEGAELEVLGSNDWQRFRPLVVVAEAIEPRTHLPSYASWEPALLAVGYEFAVDDGINRFYARADRPDLRDRLAEPVSVLDGFIPTHSVVHGVGEPDPWLLAGIVERDRALKEAEAQLAAVQRHEAELLAAVGHLRGRALELEAELSAVRWSWSLRVGRLALRPIRPFTPVLRPIGRRIRSLVRRWRGRPANLRVVAASLTAPGRPFAARVPRPLPDEPSVGELCREELLRHRRHRPRLLDPAEWEVVVHDASRGGPVELERLAALPVVAGRPVVEGPRNTLVIDAHAFDLVPCGTRTHARNILRVALDAVPEDVRVLSLLPFEDPSEELLRRFDGVWDHTDEGAVGAFLQLAPFIHDHDDTQIRLVTSPAIRSAGVFLDAIIGTNPHDFLCETERFFQYQFGLECLARLDLVLSLSGASDAEAISLGIAPDRIVRTGTVPRPATVEAGSSMGLGLPFDRWIVVIGNALVHKNLAVGVVGAAAAAMRARRGIGVLVLANVGAGQVEALHDAAIAVGLAPERFAVRTLVDDATFDAMVRGAEVVVVPSRHEGYSLPVVESLDRGVPVVVSDIPAHRELLGGGRWMFDVDDPESARRAIAWVMRRSVSKVLSRERRALATHVDPDRFDRSIRSTVAWLCEGLAARGSRGDSSRAAALAEIPEVFTVPPVVVGADRQLSLSKVCELEDFATPRLREVLREVFSHELVRFGPSFPDGAEWRKYWEVAMAVLTFRDAGLLGNWARFLGVGAGNEPTVFHLTRHAERVLATDLYLAEGWEESADSTMLTDPGRHWPFPWDPTRLEVRHMDALSLDLPDESFDGVFSSSSIEHFGDRDAVGRSLDEIFRVLRPGGVLSISTEYRIAGAPPGIPGTLLFGRDEIADLFLGGRAWSFVEPFDPSVSAATLATAAPFVEVTRDQEANVARLGGLWTHHLRYDRYPHIVLDHMGRRFTSFHLALRKDGPRVGELSS